jgi:transposase
MARKNYSEEFRRQAVDLYESTPGATVRGIAEDLGQRRDHEPTLPRPDRHTVGRSTAGSTSIVSASAPPRKSAG